MEAKLEEINTVKSTWKTRHWNFRSIKLFVLCHGMLQCSQLLYSAYFKSSIITIEKRFGLSSFSSGFLSSLHEIGNSLLIVFVSYFGNRVHRPRLIGMGGLLLSFGAFLLTIPHFISERYEYSKAANAILFAISVFGPAFGYLLGSVMLRLFVDLDKVNPATIDLTPSDPRWIGAWWLGLLVSSSILAITSIPYFFFPREMTPQKKSGSEADMLSEMDEQKMEEMSLKEFIKKFPKMLARLLLNPLFIIIVIAQCSFSSMLAGLSTYFNKFLEHQYSTTASYANFLIGSIMLPAVAIGMILGGLFMKRFHLSLAKIPWCSASILSLVIILNIPLFFLGCSTQKIAGINYSKDGNRSSSFSLQADCNAHCFCSDYTYNPVCGVDAVEYISPCHAGCTYSLFNQSTRMIITHLNCSCIQTSNNEDYARPGHCKVSCTHLLLSMVVSIAFVGFIASLTHNPLYMTVLRVVRQDEKSFAIGIQFLIMRLLAWLPAPAVFGAVIDSTCIRWNKTCTGKSAACAYYDNILLRNRYLGLQLGYNALGTLLLLIAGWKAKTFSARKIAVQNTTAL